MEYIRNKERATLDIELMLKDAKMIKDSAMDAARKHVKDSSILKNSAVPIEIMAYEEILMLLVHHKHFIEYLGREKQFVTWLDKKYESQKDK